MYQRDTIEKLLECDSYFIPECCSFISYTHDIHTHANLVLAFFKDIS